MSYYPRSEHSQTRYSTPEPDLDDHRNQNESLPPPVESGQGIRRGTLASFASDKERPKMDRLELPPMMPSGSIARDFEHAIIDDDKSIKTTKSTGSNRSNTSKLSADEEWHKERRESRSPIPARRSTFRRAIHNRQRETGAISRGSSRSRSGSRSTSPPNSVDAFARVRRGTVGSANRPGSPDRLTARDGSVRTRRPTDEGTAGHRTDVASVRSSVAEDVCFPPEDPPNTYTIDFEDLEEFVAQPHTKTAVQHPFMPHFEKSNEETKRVFEDQRKNGGNVESTAMGDLMSHFGHAQVKTEVDYEADEKVDSGDSSQTTDLKRTPSYSELQNRFTFFSSEIDETVHAPELGGLLMPDETFRDLFELGPEGGVWWLDMLNPSEEEIFAICGAFRVHPLTREDITTQETREKVELFRSYYFLCFRSFYNVDKNSEFYLEPINIYAVVFREGLLTFSFCANRHAAHVRKRIGRLRDYVNLSADWICYALIDEIVDEFAPVLRELERETESIEDNVFTARFEDSRAILQQIGECRKKVMALIRLLGGKADVIKGFAKKCNEAYSVAPRADVALYLSDVQDHIVTMMSNLGHFEKILSRSHSNHLSQISLNHIEQGAAGNKLLGKITVFATILVPLNLIAGLFGMNVHVPGQGVDGYGWFFGIIGCIILVSTTCIVAAKRLKYI